jgi:hypothetical protein
MVNNLTSQAATMVTNGVPNDVINNLDPLALIIFIPICDLFVYPGLRKIGINFTPIKRITAGFFAGSAAMVWATVVQHYIYKVCSATFEDVELLSDLSWGCCRPTPVGNSYPPVKMLMGTQSPLLSMFGSRVDRTFS